MARPVGMAVHPDMGYVQNVYRIKVYISSSRLVRPMVISKQNEEPHYDCFEFAG